MPKNENSPPPGSPEPGGSSDTAGAPETTPSAKDRRRRGKADGSVGLERIAEIHYCRGDQEANEYLSLGPEWDLQDIIPMRVETEDGGERDEIHFVVARWETDADRRRLRQRDRRFSIRKK
jgi:hypothetical protein